MNLAFQDVRRHVGRFLATSAGVGLLFTVVLAMAGIYAGLVDDATVLLRVMHADVWVVQKGTRGPFADVSRLDPSVEARVAAVRGVRRARSFTFQVLQREHEGRSLRFALVGLAWPADRGGDLPLVAGRALDQAHGEIIVDASLGLRVGDPFVLAGEELRVVGLTRQVLGSGGDAVVFATVADAARIIADLPGDAVRTERERRASRVAATDIGRAQPSLVDLAADPRWQPPAIAPQPVAAILVDAATAEDAELARRELASWPDVSVFSGSEQERLLLDGVVEKPRKQLGLFSAILVVTSSVLMAAIVYAMTLDKTHPIAILKLMGASPVRLAGMVLQQAWLMGAIGYGVAVAIGSQAFPHFPRRVVLTTDALIAVGVLVLVVSTLASLVGVAHALRVDAGRALEG